MNIKKMAKFVGLGLIIIIVAGFAGMLFTVSDVMSNTATSSETLNPTRVSVGHALVVYDPGVSGAARDAAAKIAKNIQSKGYIVDLAGVRNVITENVSGYDIIVVGGPTYGGVTSKSITTYLKELRPSNDTKVGIFATGGFSFDTSSPWYEQDKKTISEEISSIWGNSSLNNTVVKVIRGDDIDKDCMEFVSKITQ